jgi:uncharacterized YigZ family protein
MPRDRYPIPAARIRVEDEIKRSRFITTAGHACTVEDARAFIESIREEFPDATHNCWAYVVGPPGNTNDNGASDDGEPGGTAGRPMLGVLLGSGVGDVAAVVTRYFGGTKLGRGGLVRAYSGGVRRAIREMKLGERVVEITVVVALAYAAVDAARRVLPSCEARIVAEAYGVDAELTVRLPENRLTDLEAALGDATGGAVRVRATE